MVASETNEEGRNRHLRAMIWEILSPDAKDTPAQVGVGAAYNPRVKAAVCARYGPPEAARLAWPRFRKGLSAPMEPAASSSSNTTLTRSVALLACL